MTQFLNLVSGLNGPKVFVLVVELSLPHWWHWVKSLLIVETIYLLNFVGWACVALVPTKWQIFNSNKLENCFTGREMFSLLSNEILEAYIAKPISQITVLGECFILKHRRIEIRKWISKIYSKMEPMHINYNWSVHWKWIEIIFKDKWSKLVKICFQFQLKYCFYENFYNMLTTSSTRLSQVQEIFSVFLFTEG